MKIKKGYVTILVILCLILVFTACSVNEGSDTLSESNQSGSGYTISVDNDSDAEDYIQPGDYENRMIESALLRNDQGEEDYLTENLFITHSESSFSEHDTGTGRDDLVYISDQEPFIFMKYGHDGGMQHDEFRLLYSLDDGSTWNFRFVQTLDEICDGELIGGKYAYLHFDRVSGTGVNLVVVDWQSGGNTDSISVVDDLDGNLSRIASLPYVEVNDYGRSYVDVKFDEADYENGTLTLGYYMSKGKKPYCTMDVSTGTMETSRVNDTYGLLAAADEYLATGRLYSSGNTEYLDQQQVRDRCMNELNVLDDDNVIREIGLAIQEIYAAKGQDFSGTEYGEYFSSLDWYKPENGKTIVESDLNDYEKANIDFLTKLEEELRSFRKSD